MNTDMHVPTYDFYSILYKTLDILSGKFQSVSFISNTFIPTDFVGPLNRMRYLYADKLWNRRTIMHISNGIVHNDDFFVQEGIDIPTRDKMTYIAMFSNNPNILTHHKAKIIHASGLKPDEYLNFILSTCGITSNHIILGS